MSTDEQMASVMRELARSLDGVQTVIRQFRGVIDAEREFLTTAEVADRRRVSEDTVRADVKRGMPSYTQGKGSTFLWPEVLAWVRKYYGVEPEEPVWRGANGTRRVA